MKKNLVVAAVLLLIGFGGWFAYSQNKSDDDGKKNSQGQNAPQPNPADPSEGGKYLVIKEWGVRFPLPQDLQSDIEYRLNEGTSMGSSAVFSSKKLQGTNCEPLKVKTSSGEVWRGIGGINLVKSSTPLETDSSEQSVNYREIKQLDGYWYSYNTKIASCSGLSESHPDSEVVFLNKLFDSFQSLESIY